MSSYFKTMLNATLAHQKNNIHDTEIIEEFLGFGSSPKIIQPTTSQLPRPIAQPAAPTPPAPLPTPMPMYHPTPMMPMYPYFGMNGKLSKAKSDKDDDNNDDFLKLLLTAGVLGGGGVAAYKYGPKLFKNSLSDKVGAAMDNAPNAVKAARTILGDLGLANVPNNEEVPMTSGGLPLSNSQRERMAAEIRKNNNDTVINRASDAISLVPEPLRPLVGKAGGIFAGWTPDQTNAILDRANTSSESGKSTKPGKSTKSKSTASTGKKKK